jgi:alpha-1,3-rhamnosyl/mannosyltransferase
VITIHDLFFLDHPERTQAEIRRDYPALTAAHARRADAIVTPSRHVRRLVAERFGVDAERIYPCSLGAPSWKTLGERPNLPADGYLLFIGTLEPRKNIGVLLDAYERLIARLPAAPTLVLAGGAAPDARPWLDRLTRAPLHGRVRHLGYVEQHRREELYAGARTVVLPSLDEGFGLPALEAMSAGIPIVASNRGALPEVVGGAGVLLDALDPGAWAAALERLATDGEWARGRACAGLERARTYTWAAAAGTLHRAYVDAVARRSAR